jgi:hypothetical protein
MPKKGKMCLFKSYYMLILLYRLRQIDISRLMAAEMEFLRYMEGRTKREKIRNEKKLERI